MQDPNHVILEGKDDKKIFKMIMTNLEARSPNVVVVSEVVPHLGDGDMWPRDTHDSDQV
jgi:hypothetical protein